MFVVSHPVGNVNVRAVLRAFDEQDCLQSYYTTIAAKKSGWSGAAKWLPTRLSSQLQRRSYPIMDEKIRLHPWMELMRQGIGKYGFGTANQWVERVCVDLDRRVASDVGKGKLGDQTEGVYAYEDCAADTFVAARKQGLRCVYDLPIAYWRLSSRLMMEELERWPEWGATMQGVEDSARKRERKDIELENADVVMCCSRFVLDSLPQEIRRHKTCVVAEFGSDPVAYQDNDSSAELPQQSVQSSGKKKLRVLYVGLMTQRKGLADLFAAMKMLNPEEVELVVLGKTVAPLSFYQSQYPHFVYEGTKPRAQVLELMKRCDVFVLPSLVEGRALVQQEAMSCGLPMIITANTGGEDLIEEGKTGFLVPLRSPEKIAERIEWFNQHREELQVMKKLAKHKAAQYTWEEYQRKVFCAAVNRTKVKVH